MNAAHLHEVTAQFWRVGFASTEPECQARHDAVDVFYWLLTDMVQVSTHAVRLHEEFLCDLLSLTPERLADAIGWLTQREFLTLTPEGKYAVGESL